MIDHDMNIQQAIDSPRIHHQWSPDELVFEPFGMSNDTRKALELLGHKFSDRPTNIASATGIAIEDKTGVASGRSIHEATDKLSVTNASAAIAVHNSDRRPGKNRLATSSNIFG